MCKCFYIYFYTFLFVCLENYAYISIIKNIKTMSKYLPAGAANDPDAPYNEQTKPCPICGRTLYKKYGEWLHWDTGEEECYDEFEKMNQAFDLYESIAQATKPRKL